MPGVVLAPSSRSAGQRLLALTRAGVCSCIILAALLASCARSAHARLGEVLLTFGDKLTQLQDMRPNSAPRQLSVNGLSLGVLTLSTELPVSDALGRFQDLCRRRGGLQVPRSLTTRLGSAARVFDGTFRQDATTEGVLACIDSGRPLALDELVERLARFRDTGDLSALGDLRYVLARRSGSTTTLLVFWTEGSAPLLKLFPPRGDAPGRDPEGLPRPASSRRILAAAEHGAPYHLTLYKTTERSRESLLTWYRSGLEARGWQVVPAGHLLRAQRANRTVLVSGSPSADGSVIATVVELE
jgi:hypothetical protein